MDDDLRRALVASCHRPCDGVLKTSGLDGKLVIKVETAKLRDDLKSRGVLERNQKKAGDDGLSATGRSHWRRAKLSLLDSGRWFEKDGLIWKAGDLSEPPPIDLQRS